MEAMRTWTSIPMRPVLTPALGALVLSACTGVIGSGQAAQESRTVAAFTRVSTSDGIGVEVKAGEASAVLVEGDLNILPYIKTEVVGDELTIGTTEGNLPLLPQRKLMVTVSLPSLAGLSASGGARAQATGVDSPELAVAASGGSEVTIAGQAPSVVASAVDGARLFLKDLTSESAQLVARSRSAVLATVTGHAQVDASGGSSVQVEGGAVVSGSAGAN